MTDKFIEGAFKDDSEYLETLFMMQLVRLQYRYNAEIIDSEKKPRVVNKFFPTSDEINYILSKKGIDIPDGEEREVVRSWENHLQNRRDSTYASKGTLQLDDIFFNLGVSAFGVSAIIFSMMAAIDQDIRLTIEFLCGDGDVKYPTVELCGKLYFGTEYKEHEYAAYVLDDIKRLEVVFPSLAASERPYTEQLVMDGRVLSCLMLRNEGYPAFLKEISRAKPLYGMEYRDKELQQLKKHCGGYKDWKKTKYVVLSSDKGAGKKHLVSRFAEETDSRVFDLDLQYFDLDNSDMEEIIKDAISIGIRDMIMSGGMLLISAMELLDAELLRRILSFVRKKTTECRGVVFFSFDKPNGDVQMENALLLDLPECNEYQRKELWAEFSREFELEENIDLWQISNTFLFTPGQIKSALKAAEIAASSKEINKETLYKACYSQVDHSLDKKAKRVDVKFTWEDLKLPESEKELLREICNRVKNKHIVMSQWGFSDKLPYGAGTPAVFAGPPGTGKTMAAQVIANELNMEMYQIDLSQLIDKYIGETEKNIKMVFSQAKKSNSILFFDEADALFGKRVEGNSSHDRYANIESSLLLQCLEEYSGISILATNHYSTIDTAFVRRFKYLVNFRMPDEAMRLEIWKSIFPKKTPVSDEVDMEWLARQFTGSGAYIKNIALAAAFMAAEDGGAIEPIHILRGIKREMIKEGRKLEESQMGHWSYLYNSL